MSAPEILTVEDCFAAGVNAETVRRIRAWCDSNETEIRRLADTSRGSGEVTVAYWAGQLETIREVRALLPVDTKT